MALRWFGEYVPSYRAPQRLFGFFCIRQCHRLSDNRVVMLFMPAAGARTKQTKQT